MAGGFRSRDQDFRGGEGFWLFCRGISLGEELYGWVFASLEFGSIVKSSGFSWPPSWCMSSLSYGICWWRTKDRGRAQYTSKICPWAGHSSCTWIDSYWYNRAQTNFTLSSPLLLRQNYLWKYSSSKEEKNIDWIGRINVKVNYEDWMRYKNQVCQSNSSEGISIPPWKSGDLGMESGSERRFMMVMRHIPSRIVQMMK